MLPCVWSCNVYHGLIPIGRCPCFRWEEAQWPLSCREADRPRRQNPCRSRGNSKGGAERSALNHISRCRGWRDHLRPRLEVEDGQGNIVCLTRLRRCSARYWKLMGLIRFHRCDDGPCARASTTVCFPRVLFRLEAVRTGGRHLAFEHRAFTRTCRGDRPCSGLRQRRSAAPRGGAHFLDIEQHCSLSLVLPMLVFS